MKGFTMKDEFGHDKKYWKDAIGLLSNGLKACQPQNRGDYTRAIIYAERKLRLLRDGAVIALLCVVLSGCGAVRGFGEDLSGGSDAVMRSLESYSNSYNSANDIPQMIN
jgi:predicted small secreted protein